MMSAHFRRPGVSSRSAMTAVWVVALLGTTRAATADTTPPLATLAGAWSAGALTEQVRITSWVDECGPKPRNSSMPPSGYQVSVVGDELLFAGGQAYRSDGCWEQGPYRRVSHSATPSIRWWKTKCESAPGDPRKAVLTTVLRASSEDTLLMSESAHYEVTVAAGTCAADVDRSRTFKRVAAPAASTTPLPETVPPPAGSASGDKGSGDKGSGDKGLPELPAPPLPAVCQTPGPAAALEVRPKRRVIRAGESFDFRARLVDMQGCGLADQPVFRLAPESASHADVIQVGPHGRVHVRADADPLTAGVIAEVGGRSVRAELEIVSDARYAELLPALADASIDEPALSLIVSKDENYVTARPLPSDSERSVSTLRFGYLAVVGGGLALVLLAVVAWLRRTPSSTTSSSNDTSEPIALAVVPAPPRGRVCPTCGRQYEPEALFCSKDGVELVPLN